MELLADRGRRVTVDELNTTRLLAHARKQAVQRKLDDILIVDVDGHHYENEYLGEILPFMENDVLRQITMGGRARATHGAGSTFPSNAGYNPGTGGAGRMAADATSAAEPAQPIVSRPRQETAAPETLAQR